MIEDKGTNNKSLRTEEVQAIVDRMPVKFGFWVTGIILFIFSILMICGFFIKYPDVVTGQIILNSNTIPIKLVSNSSGKLMLNGTQSLQNVKENQIIGFINNGGNFKDVLLINKIISRYNPTNDSIVNMINYLPASVELGELTSQYYAFLSTLQQFLSFRKDQSFNKQKEYFNKLLKLRGKSLAISNDREHLSKQNLEYVKKFYDRDSTLISRKIISESEFDNLKMNYISNKDAYQNTLSSQSNLEQLVHETKNNLQQIGFQQDEKYRELKVAVLSSYYNLIDNIKSWQLKYVLKSPYAGKVQFLKFWVDNQFVSNGEPIYSVLPSNKKITGQVQLPIAGAGKVKIGQPVIIKLQNFPYNEYGSIKGIVKSIALTSSEFKTNQGEMESYMLTLSFPNGLKTNFGQKLDIGFEARGTAEIITNDRVLIERLFDKLRYSTN